ncbi:MAG: GAF domain-containing protein [Cyclobacteriaceae bacterium]|nr:GAF domain-containing protein [Cyclobacteriaceae bacterium]
MAEDITIDHTISKEEKYKQLIPLIKAVVEGERDIFANLGNTIAALKSVLGFFWIGFYIVKEDELVLGPFQGSVACTRIKKGKGVCGTCWEKGEVIIVPDVDQFPGHIACSSLSKSEIVLPVFHRGQVLMVFDIDSDVLNDFDAIDEKYLLEVVKIIEDLLEG